MTHLENQNRICAIIPFYNEEKHLHSIIRNVLNFVDLLILVDDGSSDSSSKNIPKSEKIILLTHSKNEGKGVALKTGILKSIDCNTDITITLDADNQHDPNFIPKFIQEISNYDAIIGSRSMTRSSMPIHRRLSNFLTSKLLSIKTGANIIDSQSGYRAFKTSILLSILPSYSGFEAESEMIVKLCKNKYSLSFLQIPTIYCDDESKMKVIPTIFGFLKVLLKT